MEEVVPERLHVLLAAPLRNGPLGLLGTKNQVPSNPSTAQPSVGRHLEVFFREEKEQKFVGFQLLKFL